MYTAARAARKARLPQSIDKRRDLMPYLARDDDFAIFNLVQLEIHMCMTSRHCHEKSRGVARRLRVAAFA